MGTKDKPKARKLYKSHYDKNKSIVLARNKRWRDANYDKIRDYRLRYSYGITLEEYKAMYDAQHRLCRICKKHKKLYVDHDHVTNRVRGLTCNGCNAILGYAQDSVLVLESAIRYLKES